METVPYILMRHADDPEEAIVRAVNDTKDNDTIAAIVGAEWIPKRCLENLPGRIGTEDDGKISQLLKRAKDDWGKNNGGFRESSQRTQNASIQASEGYQQGSCGACLLM